MGSRLDVGTGSRGLGDRGCGERLGGARVGRSVEGGECVCLEGVKKKGKVNRVRMRREADGGAT